MGVTGREMRHAAEMYVGKSIDEDMALVAINEATRKIGDMGLLYGEITIENAEAGKVYYLPNDLLHVFSVVNQHGRSYEDWNVTGERLIFKAPGTYTVIARKIGSGLKSLDEEPDIHEAYHGAIVDYLREFAMSAKSEDPRSKTMLYERFERDVTNTFHFLRRQRQPRTIKVVR